MYHYKANFCWTLKIYSYFDNIQNHPGERNDTRDAASSHTITSVPWAAPDGKQASRLSEALGGALPILTPSSPPLSLCLCSGLNGQFGCGNRWGDGQGFCHSASLLLFFLQRRGSASFCFKHCCYFARFLLLAVQRHFKSKLQRRPAFKKMLQSGGTLRNKTWRRCFRKTCPAHHLSQTAPSGQSQGAEVTATVRGSK